jgi:uncharacterized protein
VSTSLSLAAARRLALTAQLSPGAVRSKAAPRASAISKVVDRLALLQIDSVNVLSRSHYLPIFSRIGPYDRTLLDQLTFSAHERRFFEYWAHEASFLPVEHFPLLRWRMEDAKRGLGIYKGLRDFAKDKASYIAAVLDQIRNGGPLTVRNLAEPGSRVPGWWGWSPGKTALEYLFWTGEITAVTRRNFERLYDLTERVIPSPHYGLGIERTEAIRQLLLLSARALGVATLSDLRDYFRLPVEDARKALNELLEDKKLEQVSIDSWRHPAYLITGTSLPRKPPTCRSLISPFDPLVWERNRAERLFGFSYRIEIYTPAALRKYGYYVLPFLHGDRFAARACLKADRANSLLRVNSVHGEASIDHAETVHALSEELATLARFLGLASIKVGTKGNLARAMRKSLPG